MTLIHIVTNKQYCHKQEHVLVSDRKLSIHNLPNPADHKPWRSSPRSCPRHRQRLGVFVSFITTNKQRMKHNSIHHITCERPWPPVCGITDCICNIFEVFNTTILYIDNLDWVLSWYEYTTSDPKYTSFRLVEMFMFCKSISWFILLVLYDIYSI